MKTISKLKTGISNPPIFKIILSLNQLTAKDQYKMKKLSQNSK